MRPHRSGLKFTNGRSVTVSEVDTLPITVERLQEHLRVDGDSDYLESLIRVAANYAAEYMQRSLVETTRERQWDLYDWTPQLRREHVARNPLTLTYPPVKSVDRVVAYLSDGSEVELTEYTADIAADPGRVLLHEATVGREIASIAVEYTAGYEDVPKVIEQGILMHAAYLYEYRGECDGSEAGRRSGAHGMYDSYKVALI